MPPQKLKPSEFAEKYLVLPDGASAGQKIRLYAYQREMIDIIDNPQYRKVVYKTSSQVSKTTLLNSAIFYWMFTDPSNIGIAQSTGNELKQWKSGKIDVSIEAVPELKNLITDKNDKRYANNASQIQMKDGSFLYFMSLGSPNHLRGKTLKRVVLDEVSAIDNSGEEGNPIRLAENRVTDFSAEGKILISSTPTYSGDAIDIEYQNSDQREFFVNCPHCQLEHTLQWMNVIFDWEQVGSRKLPNPKTAKLTCPECHEHITESQRVKIVAKGRWIAQRPEVTDTAGFHINRLYSPNSTIESICYDFRMAWLEYSNQSFYNTVLGLHYSEIQTDLDLLKLDNLRDSTFDLENIPDEVLGIVMGVDQQLDRLECQVMGFSDKELYILGHRFFYSPNCEIRGATAYQQLTNFISQQFKTVSGRRVKVLKCFVDSGNGRATQTVLSYCNTSPLLMAIKGSSSKIGPLFKQSTSSGNTWCNLNVHEGKLWIRNLINNALSDNPDDAPLKILFSHDLPDDYFEQLTSEELRRKGDGFAWVLKQGQKRNESLDTLNYALIAMKYVLSKLGGQPFKDLRIYATKQREKLNDVPDTQQSLIENDKYNKKPKPRPRNNGNNWFS
ncbi:Bacteriophage tail assembly protein [Yersinia rohdei]|uniref:Bacteriophage tail assembly protein n=1 Tax=Yersinia rohdei TaxID=29485 RepID=A0A0U1HUR1_YERRO|nr:Bacteriophage tail assembly protein [Yersinia rohdei]